MFIIARDLKMLVKALANWPAKLTAGTMKDERGEYCAVGWILEANGFDPRGTLGNLSAILEARIMNENDRYCSNPIASAKRSKRMKAFIKRIIADGEITHKTS